MSPHALMSAIGTKRTSRAGLPMSVNRARAEVALRGHQVSFLDPYWK